MAGPLLDIFNQAAESSMHCAALGSGGVVVDPLGPQWMPEPEFPARQLDETAVLGRGEHLENIGGTTCLPDQLHTRLSRCAGH